MSLFRENRCLAFTWDSQRNYYGVLALRRGDRVAIRQIWRATAGKDESSGQVLARASAEINGIGDALVLLGGNVDRAFTHELTMPALKANDLTRALEFELPKISPLPVNEVRWGYRDLGPAATSGQRLIRLFCIADQEWQNWIDGAAGLGQGVAMMIPPTAALDPVLGDREVCLSSEPDASPFVLAPDSAGGRRVACLRSPSAAETVFGLGSAPLSAPKLDPGSELAAMPSAEARRFAPAIVLAMYGLGKEVFGDRQHGLPLPAQLRPKRHRLLKVAALLLTLYLIGGGIYLLVQGLLARQREFAAADRAKRLLATQIAEAEQRLQWGSNLPKLEQALSDVLLAHRSVGDALAEVSARLPEHAHLREFRWLDGRIALDVRSSKNVPGAMEPLKESPLFADFRLTSERPSGMVVIYNVELTMKDLRARGLETPAPEPDLPGLPGDGLPPLPDPFDLPAGGGAELLPPAPTLNGIDLPKAPDPDAEGEAEEPPIRLETEPLGTEPRKAVPKDGEE